MPWSFWFELGFHDVLKNLPEPERYVVKRGLVEYHIGCSHPYDARLVYPELGNMLPEMSMRFRSAKILEGNEALIQIYYGIRDHYDKPDFYDAWRLLREELSLKDLDVFRPIDCALIRWIAGKHVNLVEVYGDLVDGKISLQGAIRAIECGDYDLKNEGAFIKVTSTTPS